MKGDVHALSKSPASCLPKQAIMQLRNKGCVEGAGCSAVLGCSRFSQAQGTQCATYVGGWLPFAGDAAGPRARKL